MQGKSPLSIKSIKRYQSWSGELILMGLFLWLLWCVRPLLLSTYTVYIEILWTLPKSAYKFSIIVILNYSSWKRWIIFLIHTEIATTLFIFFFWFSATLLAFLLTKEITSPKYNILFWQELGLHPTGALVGFLVLIPRWRWEAESFWCGSEELGQPWRLGAFLSYCSFQQASTSISRSVGLNLSKGSWEFSLEGFYVCSTIQPSRNT